jgi:hypothetical protein
MLEPKTKRLLSSYYFKFDKSKEPQLFGSIEKLLAKIDNMLKKMNLAKTYD